jgi:hypothetical protein
MPQRSWTIVIPIAGEWLSSNNVYRDNVAQGRRIKKLRKNAYDAAMATRPKPPINLDKVLVDVLYLWGVRPVEECANLSPTLKACVDGAIGRKLGKAPGYGIVAADSDRHVKYGTVEGRQMPLTRGQVPIAKQLGQVVLTITELSPDGAS